LVGVSRSCERGLAYLLPADIGDLVLRWHRATAVVAVDIARQLVAGRRANDRTRTDACGQAAHPPALTELTTQAQALDAALEVAMQPHRCRRKPAMSPERERSSTTWWSR
jgi:hypothetical protein